MKTVLVFGTFDSLHRGHRWFLRHAASLGDRLIAVVARDDFVKFWKGQHPGSNEQSRMTALRNSGLADRVILADEQIHTYGVLRKITPDIICLGHDQKALLEDVESYLNTMDEYGPKIHVLPPWKRRRYNSSRIKNTEKWMLYTLMILAMTAFGFSWVSGKRLSATAGPATLAFLRFFFTSVACMPLLILKKPPSSVNLLKGVHWTIAAALCLVVYNLVFFFGLHTSLAGKGGLIVTTMNPLFILLIMSLTAKRPLRGTAIVGVLLGIAAGIILLEPWTYTGGELADPGNLVFMGASLAWSLMTLSAVRAQGYLGFIRFIILLYIFASLLAFPPAFIESGGIIFKRYAAAFWGDILFLSMAVGAYGTGIYFMVSKKLGADRGSAFIYLVPVSVIGFTWILLGEVPKPLTIFGGMLAIAAFLIIND